MHAIYLFVDWEKLDYWMLIAYGAWSFISGCLIKQVLVIDLTYIKEWMINLDCSDNLGWKENCIIGGWYWWC